MNYQRALGGGPSIEAPWRGRRQLTAEYAGYSEIRWPRRVRVNYMKNNVQLPSLVLPVLAGCLQRCLPSSTHFQGGN